MICPKCGRENLENVNFCVACGESLNSNIPQQPDQQSAYQANYPVNNHMVLSILTTIFCCIPFGIVAIVYSSKVSKLQNLGDIKGAIEASKKAKMWGIIALICGIVSFAINLFVLSGIMEGLSIYDSIIDYYSDPLLPF